MVNQFGNYLCQKIIERACPGELQMIVEQICDDAATISCNIHGTRVMQTIVEKLAERPETLQMVIRVLEPNAAWLINDINGNHVLQSILMKLKASNLPHENDYASYDQSKSLYTNFIVEACVNNCIAIGTHKHGCCVM